MNTITHSAGRMAAGKTVDVILKKADKNREKEFEKVIDFIQNYMDGEKIEMNFENWMLIAKLFEYESE